MTLSAEKRLKSAAVFMALGGLLIAAAGFCYLHFTPKTFQATARIRVWQTGRVETNARAAFDADVLLRLEIQVIRSDAILDRAIQHLGEPWNQPGGRDRLRLITETSRVPDSGIIQITATGDSPLQLAAIANEIARAYLDRRQTGRQETTREHLDSLKAELTALDPKLLQAWSNLARACQDFVPSSNGPALYDPLSYELLQSNRVKMDLDASRLEQRLAKFKSMNREELRQALPVFDGRTNVFLVSSLDQLNHARADLAAARTRLGPDSVEVQQDVKVVAELDKNVDDAVAGALASLTMELSTLKRSLELMNQKLDHATTNQDVVIAAHPELAAPARELQKLEEQRKALALKIQFEDSVQASLPDTISASLIEPAEPPVRPVSPDARIADGVLAAGGILAAAGLFLRFLMPKPKLVPVKRD